MFLRLCVIDPRQLNWLTEYLILETAYAMAVKQLSRLLAAL